MKISFKSLIYINISSLLFGLSAFSKVPSSWIKSSAPLNFVQTAEDEKTPNTMGEDLQKLVKATYGFVSPNQEQKDQFGLSSLKENTKKGPWYLASIKTELGIEAGGEIGMIGAEGEAAVEYIWKRTARSIKKLQAETYKGVKKPVQKTENFMEPNTLSLSTDMSTSDVDRKIDELVGYVASTKKISDFSKMKYQLTQHVKHHQLLAQKVSESSQNMTWKPYKYQLELYVTASGSIIPTVEIGGVVRLRIEWNIVEKKTFVASAPTNFAKHVEMLTNELSLNFNQQKAAKSQFELYGIKVGLGLGAGGDIGLAELKGHYLASVFLKYNPPQANFVNGSRKTFETSPSEVIKGIPAGRWQQGIQKVSKMASYIVNQSSIAESKMDATHKNRDFELGAIEVEIELSADGEFVLPTVKGIAFMEIFFNKKKSLN